MVTSNGSDLNNYPWQVLTEDDVKLKKAGLRRSFTCFFSTTNQTNICFAINKLLMSVVCQSRIGFWVLVILIARPCFMFVFHGVCVCVVFVIYHSVNFVSFGTTIFIHTTFLLWNIWLFYMHTLFWMLVMYSIILDLAEYWCKTRVILLYYKNFKLNLICSKLERNNTKLGVTE